MVLLTDLYYSSYCICVAKMRGCALVFSPPQTSVNCENQVQLRFALSQTSIYFSFERVEGSIAAIRLNSPESS